MVLAVCKDIPDLTGVAEVAGEVGREEFGGIVAFQPSGLVGHPGITGSVGLVECVLGELLPVFPYLVEGLFRMAVCHSAGHELVLQFVQDGNLLLAHRLAELVGLAFRETGQLLGEEHHLLLVDRDAVGVLEELLHLREIIFNALRSEFPVYEIWNILHRARTV